MGILEAVEVVLNDESKPLNYREITQLIIQRGLWISNGKTPEATVNAQIAVDIKNQGPCSRFQRTAPGVFALRESTHPEQMVDSPNGKTKTGEDGKAKLPSPSKSLSFTDAAEKVLSDLGGRKPMHYRDITKKALANGLIFTQGQTPEATLYAQILTEVARDTKRGKTPRFVKHGKGLVGLTRWAPDGLASQIEQHNRSVIEKLHARLLSTDPAEFEALIGQLLVAIGFAEVTVTSRSGDGGIDVRGTLVVGDVIRTNMAVQVKRWKNNVQAPIVQQVRGSLSTHEQGLIITTSDFSAGASEEAQLPNKIPVALMNGEQLVSLLVEHDLGVSRTSHDLIELAEDDEDQR